MRLYGAILLLIGLGLLAGCPHPKNAGGTKPHARPANKAARAPAEAAKGLPGRQTDTAADAESADTEAGAGDSEETAEGAAGPDGTVDTAGEGEASETEPPAEAEQPGEAGTEVTFPNRKRDQGDQAQDVLNPGSMLGGAAEEPVSKHEPPARLSAEARAFSGEWSVVVVNQDGHSRLAERDDEWQFALDDDGSCIVSLKLKGNTSEQSGRWELKDDLLTLRLGPARRDYGIEQPRDGVALFTDATAGAVLFCVRLVPGERAPLLKQSYELGGSELTFRSAGPGGYWRGTLTEPQCSLLVRPVGRFVAGTWETDQDNGYVLLELTDDGFDGWWWYADSTSFDGVWRSGAD